MPVTYALSDRHCDEGGIRPSRLPATRLSRLPASRRSVTSTKLYRRRGPCCGFWDTCSSQDMDRRRTVPARGRVSCESQSSHLSESVRPGHAPPSLTRFPPVEEKPGRSPCQDEDAHGGSRHAPLPVVRSREPT